MAEKQMDELLKIFPADIREIMRKGNWYRDTLEEIRIRVNQPLRFWYGNNVYYLDKTSALVTEREWGMVMKKEHLQEMMMYLCEYSKYAYNDQLSQGFVTLEGGVRVGIAGVCGAKRGEDFELEYPMFLNVRIPGEKKGCGKDVLPYLLENGMLKNTLILSEPGRGKTTLLRDLVRLLSERETCRGIALIDERYEIAAVCNGVPQRDVGYGTDVYSGYGKARGCMQAVRTMAPEIIAVDEIGGEADWRAIEDAAGRGVKVLATMHGEGGRAAMSDWYVSKYSERFRFQRFVTIFLDAEGRRRYRIYDEWGKEICARR